MEDDKYADLTITCQGETFKVHRAVVCPRCKFFEACCEGGFKEAKERVIDLPEDDPKAVKLMLDWLYTYNLPKWNAIVEVFEGKVSGTLALYLVADKYGLGTLAEQVKINVASDVRVAIGVTTSHVDEAEQREKGLRKSYGAWRPYQDIVFMWHQIFAHKDAALDALKRTVLNEMKLGLRYHSHLDAGFRDDLFMIPEIAKILYQKAIEDHEDTKRSLFDREEELREKLLNCRRRVRLMIDEAIKRRCGVEG